MSETFKLHDIQNDTDKDMLRKGRCPWCLLTLIPVFENDKHVADVCDECGDRFEG